MALDVDAVDSSGATALHIAAKPWGGENVGVGNALIEAGADLNALDRFLRKPLDIANAASHADIAQILAGQ